MLKTKRRIDFIGISGLSLFLNPKSGCSWRWRRSNGSPPDADLGGGLYKFRIARPGEGARGGGRALVALKVGRRAVLMFGWEKKDMENITPKELKVYRLLAKTYLRFAPGEISIAVNDGTLLELRQPQ